MQDTDLKYFDINKSLDNYTNKFATLDKDETYNSETFSYSANVRLNVASLNSGLDRFIDNIIKDDSK